MQSITLYSRGQTCSFAYTYNDYLKTIVTRKISTFTNDLHYESIKYSNYNN